MLCGGSYAHAELAPWGGVCVWECEEGGGVCGSVKKGAVCVWGGV